MNFKTTVILLVVLVGALTFFLIASRSGETDAEKAKLVKADPNDEKGRKLLDVAAADVAKLVIRPGPAAPAGAKPLELTNAGGQWQIVQPIATAADSFEARNLVEAITDARSTGSVDLTDDLKKSTGLASPRFVVELTDTKGKTRTLTVGERNALGRLYVSTADNPSVAATVTGGQLAERIGRPTDKVVASIRDKQLVRGVSSFDAKQLTIDLGNGKSYTLHKQGQDWRLLTPAAAGGAPADSIGADTAEVSDILSTVTNLRADEFADAAAAEGGGATFDKPRAVVTISTASPVPPPTTGPATAPATVPAGKSVTVTIGQAVDIEGEKTWVKVSDPASVAKASLGKTSFDKLAAASPLTLRDKKVFDVDPEVAAEVTVAHDPAAGGATKPTTQPTTVRLTRRKENLQLGPELPKALTPSAASQPAATQPATQPAATQPATKPAAAAAAFRVPALLAAVALLQADAPAATAPATQPTTAAAATQPAAAPPSTQTAASMPATQPVATTTAATGPATVPTTAAAVPIIPAVPPAPPTKWVIASSADVDADDAGVSDLLFDLHPLRATKYLDKVPPATRPVAATYVVTVKTVAAGGLTATHELHITDPGGDAKLIGQYKDLAFELDRAILTKLNKDFTKKAGQPAPAPTTPPIGSDFPPP